MDMSHILRPTGLVWIFGQSHLLDLGTSMFWTAGMITEYRVESASRSNVRNRLYPKVRTGSASQNQRRRWSDGRDGRGGFLFIFFFLVFSRMRSKGSLFTLGVWGLRVCSLDVAFVVATVRNRPQPSATVRVRTMAVPMWSFAEVVLFGGFRRLVASFRVAGVALRDIQTCSGTCRKSFLRGRRNTFVTFSKGVLQFSWQAQHFGRVHRHFPWQAQHFRRVLLRVFCKSHWQCCVKWRQGANSVAVVAFCAMCWKLTDASHETSILRLQIFRFKENS